jgi:lysophospholipase L1-like esterase
MRYFVSVCAISIALCAGVRAEVVVRESFEDPSRFSWQKSWGPAKITDERAQDGKYCLKEEVENEHGLSVYFLEMQAIPGAKYTLTGYVYVPGNQAKKVKPCLSLNRRDWGILASATTDKTDEWVPLKVEFQNKSDRFIRIQLYEDGQVAGQGGAVLYWDNIVLDVEGGVQPVNQRKGVSPDVIKGLEIKTAGNWQLTVTAGECEIDGRNVVVAKDQTVAISPPVEIPVVDEKVILGDAKPESYNAGTRLQFGTIEGIGCHDCIDPTSVVVRSALGGGDVYTEGKDYLLEHVWGGLGRVADGRIKAGQPVYVSYTHGLQRVDTIQVGPGGDVQVRQGISNKTTPIPAGADEYHLALANVYIPYHCKGLTDDQIYPIGEAFRGPGVDWVDAQRATIPKTLEKLRKGENVTIVTWGDSVTAGGSASSPEKAFPLLFANTLRGKYPDARIKLINAGIGGSSTWGRLKDIQAEVIAFKPDLVTIEFVNDMGMDRDTVFQHYNSAIDQIRAAGGEVILITPHFVMPMWMPNFKTGWEPESRATVTFLREFAKQKGIGLADTSKRWEHLSIEGIPYVTYEYNGINHPDDRGHRMFVDELMRLF